MRCTRSLCAGNKTCGDPAVPGKAWCWKHLVRHREYQRKRRLAARGAGRCAWGRCDRRATELYCDLHRKQLQEKRKTTPPALPQRTRSSHLNADIARIAGTMSDRAAGALLGCTGHYVRSVRLALGIQAFKPKGKRRKPVPKPKEWHEPTMEELNALIAKRLKTMPPR